MNIEVVKAKQRELGLLGKHLCYTNAGEFWLAHTDAERDNSLMISLTECAIHLWLSSLMESLGFEGYCVIESPGTFWRSQEMML